MKTKESRARERVHRLLPKAVHKQSMSGTPEAGTPDHWYAGMGSTLWVEWKYTDAKQPRTPPNVSELQARWLRRAHEQHEAVAVIEAGPGERPGMRHVVYRIYPGLTWAEPDGMTSAHIVIPKPQPSPTGVALWIRRVLRQNGKLRNKTWMHEL